MNIRNAQEWFRSSMRKNFDYKNEKKPVIYKSPNFESKSLKELLEIKRIFSSGKWPPEKFDIEKPEGFDELPYLTRHPNHMNCQHGAIYDKSMLLDIVIKKRKEQLVEKLLEKVEDEIFMGDESNK